MTEVRLAAPVKATLVDDALTAGIAGAFSFEESEDKAKCWGFLRALCPCGCEAFHRLPIGLATKPEKVDGRATWRWDGNRAAPTLSPSIHHIGHWHGYLRAGFWVQA